MGHRRERDPQVSKRENSEPEQSAEEDTALTTEITDLEIRAGI